MPIMYIAVRRGEYRTDGCLAPLSLCHLEVSTLKSQRVLGRESILDTRGSDYAHTGGRHAVQMRSDLLRNDTCDMSADGLLARITGEPLQFERARVYVVGMSELCSCIIRWSQEGYILMFRVRSRAVCSPHLVPIVPRTARPRRLMYQNGP
jgi:hypothetical protein